MSVGINTSVEDFEFLFKLIPFLIPLIIIQLGLMIFAIVDIAKKNKTKTLTPMIWIIISVVLSNMGIGPVLYLILGRAEKTYDDDDI